MHKEALQLVGAVALMLTSNHFCKLPHQDGERPVHEHALNHAEARSATPHASLLLPSRPVFAPSSLSLCVREGGRFALSLQLLTDTPALVSCT